MNNPSGKSKPSLLDALLRLFNRRSPTPLPYIPPARPVIPPDNTEEPVRIVTTRVLLVIYDPVMDPASGVKLSQQMRWQSSR